MAHLSSSALEQHYLESILPRPFRPQQHCPKSRQFYKPEQFIWNNPHRASRPMFQFYHAYNKHYQAHQAPVVEQLQAKDRQEAQLQRIRRLTDFRNKTRQKFSEIQQSRLQLQNKARQRSTPSEQTTLGLQSQCQTINNPNQRTKSYTRPKQQPQSQRLLHIEQTYKKSVMKYDTKTEEIHQLIKHQNQENHGKIRSEFANRKFANDTNPSFYPELRKKTLQ